MNFIARITEQEILDHQGQMSQRKLAIRFRVTRKTVRLVCQYGKIRPRPGQPDYDEIETQARIVRSKLRCDRRDPGGILAHLTLEPAELARYEGILFWQQLHPELNLLARKK